MNVSLYFYSNEEKMNARKGIFPIYIRVRLNGRKAEGCLYPAGDVTSLKFGIQ